MAIVEVNNVAFCILAGERGLDPDDLEPPACKSLMLNAISKRLKDFPRHTQPRAVHLTRDIWSIETGLRTPTLKVKRQIVEQKYAAEITRLYAERRS